jgi:aminoglycoside phosphotransferase (APT) family kinase protein
MPAAEIDIDEALVRSLLRVQHPDLAGRPLIPLAFGWDNVLFRLGHDLLVRLPRRALAAPLVAHELRWLPELAPLLPLPIPAPVRAGVPSPEYPWSWTIVPWFEGTTALAQPPVDPEATASSLGSFLAALHQPAPPDAPANPFRGVPLTDRQERFDESLELLDGRVDAPRMRALWADLCSADPWPGPPVWVHGDVHPGNLIVAGGALVAVADWGDLTAGDPASDLAGAWMLLPASARPTFRSAAGAHRPLDDHTWARARAWALALGAVILANSADNPAYAGLGERTLAAALAG